MHILLNKHNTEAGRWKGQSSVMLVSYRSRSLRVTLIKCRMDEFGGCQIRRCSLMEYVDRRTKHICDDGTACSVMLKFSAGEKRAVIKNMRDEPSVLPGRVSTFNLR